MPSHTAVRLLLVCAGPLLAIAAVVATPIAATGLAFDVPSGWAPAVPSSSMRVAEFALPAAEGDAEDASLVLYFFPGGGGSVEANIDRWIGQVEQPDGSPSKAAATTTTLKSTAGLALTVVDVAGRYVAEVTPGSAERFDKPGFRLIAAYINAPDGPYYMKLVGPQATIAKWHDSVQTFLRSMRPGPPDGLNPPSSPRVD